MTHTTFFSLIGISLFMLGLYALISYAHLLRKILALNIMSSGLFLFLIATGSHNPHAVDSIPHALVLIGLLIMFGITALALALAKRIYRTSGQTCLPEEDSGAAP